MVVGLDCCGWGAWAGWAGWLAGWPGWLVWLVGGCWLVGWVVGLAGWLAELAGFGFGFGFGREWEWGRDGFVAENGWLGTHLEDGEMMTASLWMASSPPLPLRSRLAYSYFPFSDVAYKMPDLAVAHSVTFSPLKIMAAFWTLAVAALEVKLSLEGTLPPFLPLSQSDIGLSVSLLLGYSSNSFDHTKRFSPRPHGLLRSRKAKGTLYSSISRPIRPSIPSNRPNGFSSHSFFSSPPPLPFT